MKPDFLDYDNLSEDMKRTIIQSVTDMSMPFVLYDLSLIHI